MVELSDGRPIPYPSESYQEQFESILSLRVDRQNRLWTLDNANHGRGQPRLLAFDLATCPVQGVVLVVVLIAQPWEQ